MLLIEHPQFESETIAEAPPDVRLRIHGGARDLETISLVAGHHAFGSGPKCSVRLRDAGVGPMHGLITLDGRGARVRRWADGTLLNGRGFDEECLSAGDRLSVGPIDLEIIAPATLVGTWHQIGASPEVPSDEDDEPVAPVTAAVEKSLDDFQETVASLDASDEPTSCAAERPAKRRANRKLRSALRRQQTAFERLLSRVDGLAERVETALAERQVAAATVDVEDARLRLGTSWDAESFEESPPVQELIAWAEERLAHIDRNAELEAELDEARQRLSDASAELAAAQASIDELQARLTESQRTWEELSEDRALWQRQLADLETQLVELSAETRRLEDELDARETKSAIEPRADVTAWPPDKSRDDVPAPALSYEPVNSADDGVAAEEGAREESLPTAVESSDTTESQRQSDSYDWSSRSTADEWESLRDAAVEPENDAQGQWTWMFGKEVAKVEGVETDAPWDIEAQSDRAEDVADRAADKMHLLKESVPNQCAGGLAAPAAALKKTSSTTPDIDGVVAHLRELALWRQTHETDETTESEPVAAEEEAVTIGGEAGNSSVAESLSSPVGEETGLAEAPPQPEPKEEVVRPTIAGRANEPVVAPIADFSGRVETLPATPATTSFIQRYAHTFEQDTSAERPQTLVSEVSSKEGPKPVRIAEPLVPSRPQVSDAASMSGEAEDSIENYMARMMQRIRGDAAASGSSSGSQAVASVSSNAGAIQRANEASGRTNSPAKSASTANATVEAPAEQPLIRLEDLKSKVPTPEFATDMGALRALANQSARHAIGVHTARTLRRKATTRFIVSLLAGVTSLYFMLNAPDWQSREFSTACVALIASIYWGQMTAVSLLKAVRVGAFDEIATDFTPVDKSPPALPIDVSRR